VEYIPASGPASSATGLSAAANRGARSAYTHDLVHVAVAQQSDEGTLHRPRGALVDDRAAGVERVEDRGRRHQPAEPQRRRDRLRRGAEVGHPVPVQAGQGRHRRDVVAELGVVVVLDHDRPAPARGVEQDAAVGGRHHPAERMLVGRSDVRRRDAGQVGDRRERRQVDDAPARAAHGLDRGAVARVLQAHRAGAEDGEQMAQPVGGAAGDDHLVGVDAQAAQPAQPVGEQCAQLGQAPRVVVPARRSRRGDLPPRAPPPRRMPRVDPGRAGVETHERGRGSGGAAAASGGGRDRVRGHERARAAVRGQPAFGQQLVVGLLGDRAADAEVDGERARAGQPVAPGEGALEDQLADGRGELGAQRIGSASVEGDGEDCWHEWPV